MANGAGLAFFRFPSLSSNFLGTHKPLLVLPNASHLTWRVCAASIAPAAGLASAGSQLARWVATAFPLLPAQLGGGLFLNLEQRAQLAPNFGGLVGSTLHSVENFFLSAVLLFRFGESPEQAYSKKSTGVFLEQSHYDYDVKHSQGYFATPLTSKFRAVLITGFSDYPFKSVVEDFFGNSDLAKQMPPLCRISRENRKRTFPAYV